VSVNDVTNLGDLPAAHAYRLEYVGREDYKKQAGQLGLMDDLKVSRMGFISGLFVSGIA